MKIIENNLKIAIFIKVDEPQMVLFSEQEIRDCSSSALKSFKYHFAPEKQLFKCRMLVSRKKHLIPKDLYCVLDFKWL